MFSSLSAARVILHQRSIATVLKILDITHRPRDECSTVVKTLDTMAPSVIGRAAHDVKRNLILDLEAIYQGVRVS